MKGRLIAASLLSLCCAAGSAYGQAAPPPSHEERIDLNSGMVLNRDLPDPDGEAKAVFVTTISAVSGSGWVRLAFDEVVLAGSRAQGNASYLQITSAEDGAVQKLDAEALESWGNTSCYFNGDTVILELYAFPGTGENRVSMSEFTAGDPALIGGAETICGSIDNRAASMDPRQGRIIPVGCTAWLITDGSCSNRFLTAGHCLSNSSTGQTVQFNVPRSSSTGSLRHPGPENQYPIQTGGIRSSGDVGSGNDYCVFHTNANTTTGYDAYEMQGSAYVLHPSAPAASNQTLTIAGYGLRDGSAPTPVPFELNQIQKVHTGPYTAREGNRIRHRVDTTGGNSGSPITFQTLVSIPPFTLLVERAIGIHTHGGCEYSGTSSANAGTAIDHPTLQNWLDNPFGTCHAYDAIPCLSTSFDDDNGGAIGGAVYFNVRVKSNDLEVVKLRMNVGEDVGTDFDADVYIRPGGYQGFTNSSSGWTLAGQGSSSSAGDGNATLVPLWDTFVLDANMVYGVAIVVDNVSHQYTNQTASNGFRNGSNLEMEFGAASNSPFTGTINDRVFNGSLCYEVLPTGDACGAQADMPFYTGPFSGEQTRGYYFVAPVNMKICGLEVPNEGSQNVQNVTVIRLNATPPLFSSTTNSFTTLYTRTDAPAGELIATGGIQVNAGQIIGVLGGCGTSPLIASYASGGPHTTSIAGHTVDLKRLGMQTNLNTTGVAADVFTETSGTIGRVKLFYSVDGCAEMNIPAYNSTFEDVGGTRGYWFRSPRNITICGLEVPNESEQTVQNVAVVRFDNNAAPPSYSATTNAFTTLYLDRSEPTEEVLFKEIPVLQNQVIGILGACGTSTMHNSYASSNTFNTQIAGVNTQLKRLGMQYNLWTTNPRELWTEDGSPISRVRMFYTQGIAFCDADCDQNLGLDIFDILCFLNLFNAGKPSANCDGVGGLDIFDILCFLNKFNAGCETY